MTKGQLWWGSGRPCRLGTQPEGWRLRIKSDGLAVDEPFEKVVQAEGLEEGRHVPCTTHRRPREVVRRLVHGRVAGDSAFQGCSVQGQRTVE